MSCVDHWNFYVQSAEKAKDILGKITDSEQDDAPDMTGQDAELQSPEPSAEDIQPATDEDGGEGQEQSATPAPSEEENTSHRTEDGFWDGTDPIYMTVEDDYFSDAVFIGDSRTVGMYDYGGLQEISTFYASKGMTIYRLLDAEVAYVSDQSEMITIEEALQLCSFKKIYLMVGINEMGTGTVETFAAKYKEVVDRLLELQPEAILYVQGILKVTTERSEKGDYINNEGIIARNQEIEKLADNRRIFYLDANPEICDDTGGMEPSYTFDGVHLKGKYIEIWKNYLKNHAVNLDAQ